MFFLTDVNQTKVPLYNKTNYLLPSNSKNLNVFYTATRSQGLQNTLFKITFSLSSYNASLHRAFF